MVKQLIITSKFKFTCPNASARSTKLRVDLPNYLKTQDSKKNKENGEWIHASCFCKLFSVGRLFLVNTKYMFFCKIRIVLDR